MAILCLSYLSSSCFRYSAQDMARRLFLNAGYYAFQDYAIAKWEAHLITAIENVDSLDQHDRQKLTMTLARFVEVYETDLNSEKISDKVESLAVQDCRATENCEFYHDLLLIRRHRLNHEEKEIKIRNLVSFGTLREEMEKSRSAIRAMAEDATPNAKIKKLYGEGLWKCERVTCPYFHEGYDTETSLEQHQNRHTRPFICPQNCSSTPFGFSTSRDMERHKRMYHPDLLEQTDSFKQLGLIEARENREGGPKWRCELCDKRYTRAAILKHHTDSAHLGIRSFACTVCGKEFTRKNDRTRHERTVHAMRA